MSTYFFLIGRPQHGKTTVSKYLSKLRGEPYGSTSDYVYVLLARKLGTTVEELKQRPKESIRPLMVVEADALCDVTPTGLVDGLVASGVRIIDGIRRRKELQMSVKKLQDQGHTVHVWWISNPRQAEILDNTAVTVEDAQACVVNDGSFELLYQKIDRMLGDKTRGA